MSYAKEAGPPSPECTSFTHDRDYVVVNGEGNLDPLALRRAERHAKTAWCPPPPAEYAGFRGGPGRYKAIDPKFHGFVE